MRRYTIKVGSDDYTIDVQELAANRFRVWIAEHELEVTLTSDTDIAEAHGVISIRLDDEVVELPNRLHPSFRIDDELGLISNNFA